MKKSILIIISLMISLTLFAQAKKDSSSFERKGRLLIETGYGGLFGGIGSGTGGAIFFAEGETLTQLKFEGGYFLSEDFVLKASFGFIDFFDEVKSIGIGGKYYAGGKAPIDVSFQTFFDSDDDNLNTLSASIGYAIPLAQNIYLEPSLGILKNLSEDDAALFKVVNFKFALIL